MNRNGTSYFKEKRELVEVARIELGITCASVVRTVVARAIIAAVRCQDSVTDLPRQKPGDPKLMSYEDCILYWIRERAVRKEEWIRERPPAVCPTCGIDP